MKWSDFRDKLPERPTEKRSEMLREAAIDHHVPFNWCVVSAAVGSYLGILYVANDALRVGEPGDSCRVNFSHHDAQVVVDNLGFALPTDKIADLIHEQATVRIPPRLQPEAVKNGTMAHTSVMQRHSMQIDNKGPSEHSLNSTVGKHWITHNLLTKRANIGVNYGWHHSRAPYKGVAGYRMWQTVGTAHNMYHVDYSQVLVPVNRIMLVNGDEMLLEEVMQHPELSRLVSYSGPMKASRHPNVPPPEGGVPVVRI